MYLLGALIAAAVVLVVLALSSSSSGASDPAERLRQLSDESAAARSIAKALPARRRAKDVIGEKIIEPVGRAFASAKNQHKTREALVHAGFRRPAAASVFSGAKVLLTVALPLAFAGVKLASGQPLSKVLLPCAVIAVIGMRLPSFWLSRQVKKRQGEINDSLPDGLDLLVVCVEAGLGLDAALVRISDEFRLTAPALSDEFHLVNLEIRAGRPRQEALRNIGLRTGVEEVRSLAARLIQADKFGTSIAKSLRTHSDSLRSRRRQRAEEKAAKTSVKLLFPLVLFIFPALFVVILGPAAVKILDAMQVVPQ